MPGLSGSSFPGLPGHVVVIYVVVIVVGGGGGGGGRITPVGLGQPLVQVTTSVTVMVLVRVTGMVQVDVPLVVVE